MSTHLMPAHGAVYFTCDFVGGKPERRSTCRAAETVSADQGALWLDPAAVLPSGWKRSGGGHLCDEHAGQVPAAGHVALLVFSGAAPDRGPGCDPS